MWLKCISFSLLLSATAISGRGVVRPRERSLLDEHNVRIVGGEEVEPNSIPYQISYQIDFGLFSAHTCGGSIIDESHVMTAAHCCTYPADRLVILAGVHDLYDDDGWAQRRAVTDVAVHEDWNEFTFRNDLCLLTLQEPLQFNTNVSAVTLPEQDEQFEAGTAARVSGWGNFDENENPPTVLYAVESILVSDDDCVEAYADFIVRYDPDTMICYGEADKGSCQGDSGGPLVCGGNDGVQCGIVSWAKDCAEPDFPSVCAEVAMYRDWLDARVTL